MGLLDTALGMLGANNQANDPKAMLIQAAIGLLSNQQQGGGLQNLLGAFQNAGLGNIVSSWVSTGQNLPISADQIQQALGGGHLSQLASASGLSHEDTAQQLSDLLPGLIDKMTPNGQVPDHANIDPAALMQQFSSLFGKS